MLTEDLKVKNFATYKKYLINLITEVGYNRLVKWLGGEEELMNASFGMSQDSGSAFEGSLIDNSLRIAKYACDINNLLPDELKVKNSAIYKVALLSHISKVVMYVKNDSTWEVTNRGLIYKFKELETYLKSGERSVLIAMNAGISFTDDEYEAMRIVDRIKENDGSSLWYAAGTLATVIRQANEIVTLENKKNGKK